MLIRINVDSPADKITEFGAGAKLYWYRDNTSSTGAFTDASGSTTLVSTQSQYEIIDATGAEGHYYRSRVGNTGGTVFDAYGPVFQAGARNAYATLDALREIVANPDDSQDNLLSDILVRVSASIDAYVGHDFYRHPVTGTEVRTYDGTGRAVIHIPEGIISLTTVQQAAYTGAAYTTLVLADYYLEPDNPRTGHPYIAIELSPYGSYRYWPAGKRTVRLTGAFGYSTIPPDIEQACLIWAADLYRQGPGGGGPVGINQFGTPIFGQGIPRIVRDTLNTYRPVLVA